MPPALTAALSRVPWSRAALARHAPALLPWLALPLQLAYPPVDLWPVAWLALAPVTLLLAHGRGSLGAWAWAAWGFGLVHHGLQMCWLPWALSGPGGLPVGVGLGFATVAVATLALFPAAALWLARALGQWYGLSPLWSFPVLFAAQDALLGVFPFGGMPWASLAATQTATLAARWVVPLAGGSALVLLLGLVNGGWAWVLGGPGPEPRRAARGTAAAVLTVALLWPLDPPPVPAGSEPVDVLLVTSALSIATQRARESSAADARYFVARTAAAGPPPGGGAPARALAVWPESAVGGLVEQGRTLVHLSRMATVLGIDLIFGSDARDRGRDYNAAYLVPAGTFDFERYAKRNRVPFGEYVPGGFGWLFGRKLTAGEQDYAAGAGPPVLDWHGTRVGVAICFEGILPGHLRLAAREGARLAVVLSNDAWLPGWARRQHLLLTALQGLAVGRDVVFVANGGRSALLRGGTVTAAAEGRAPPAWTRAALSRGRTPWVRWGPLPLGLALLAVAAIGVRAGRRG